MTNDLVSDLLSLKPFLEAHHCRTDAIDRAIAVIGKRPMSDDLVTRPRFHVEGQTSTEGPRWQIWDGVEGHFARFRNIADEGDARLICETLDAMHAAIEQHTGLVAENERLRAFARSVAHRDDSIGDDARAALAHPQGEEQ